jgi:hypothetical protein
MRACCCDAWAAAELATPGPAPVSRAEFEEVDGDLALTRVPSTTVGTTDATGSHG